MSMLIPTDPLDISCLTVFSWLFIKSHIHHTLLLYQNAHASITSTKPHLHAKEIVTNSEHQTSDLKKTALTESN